MGRLEWNRSVERDRNVLERILALLLALAVLTDRAAGLPAARRLHLLSVLGHGEAIARDFILAMATGPDVPVEPTSAPPPAANDAALLATRFRMLALALGILLTQARSPCRHASPPPVFSPAPLPGFKPRRPAQNTPSPALRATSPP